MEKFSFEDLLEGKSLQNSEQKIQKTKIPDEDQQKVINSKENKIIVQAGGGSGKTFCLVEKINKILNDGVEPSNLVAITFTNMAAEEMKERLSSIYNIGDAFIGTIHSFANKILKASNLHYELLTAEVNFRIMSSLLTEYSKYTTIEDYSNFLEISQEIALGTKDESAFKEKNVTPVKIYEIRVLLGNESDSEYPDNLKKVCERENIITFDELIVRTSKYFKEINGKIEYLFVDEYQDVGVLEDRFFESLNADNYFLVRR